MGQSTDWEIRPQLALESLDKVFPHESTGSIVGEWEVNLLREELFEILLGALFRITRATDDCYPLVLVEELSTGFRPLGKSLLNTLRIG